MANRMVGIRELKARLSAYIQDVKRGDTVTITERGNAVARITPADEPLEDRLQNLVRSGIVAWSGKELKPGRPLAKVKPGVKTISEIVVENRD